MNIPLINVLESEQYNPDTEGVVFNIQRFSVHDGPGIRTVVFLKGCSLRCNWCSNPESIKQPLQVGIYRDRCLGTEQCDACLTAGCRRSPLFDEDNKVASLKGVPLDEQIRMANACPTGALRVWGEKTTVGDVMKEVLADQEFYRESGGGLTLSGGEALLQTEFARELLKGARSHNIHTCVETALHYPSAKLDQVLEFIDLALCDMKHMDAEQHKEFTGVSNKRILENLKKVVQSDTPVVIRIPVVPDHNDSEQNMLATARFITEQLQGRVKQVQLLPFRKLGEEKYRSLQMRYPMETFNAPDREVWEQNIRHLVQLMVAQGVPAVAGTGHKLEPCNTRSEIPSQAASPLVR